jgi:hypothetical protein
LSSFIAPIFILRPCLTVKIERDILSLLKKSVIFQPFYYKKSLINYL